MKFYDSCEEKRPTSIMMIIKVLLYEDQIAPETGNDDA